MKTIFSVSFLCVLIATCTVFPGMSVIQQIPVKGYSLAWSDEFNGNSLDHTKWKHRGLGKREDAYITGASITLDGKGNLIIEASKKGDSILTGMIATENIFHTRYGYFECRAILTRANGIIPAFWLQSPQINRGTDPGESGAEIDIFEYFPHAKKDSVAHTLHWGGYGSGHKVAGPAWGALKNTGDGYHTFGLEWTENSYTTYVDGVKTYTGNTLISKVPEFIVLSLDVNKAAAGPLDVQRLPGRFVIDYVRVYKKSPGK